MMTVTAIWRYPVKSMAGERVGSTELTETGLVGDRVVSGVLRDIVRRFRGQLCLNAAVTRAGRVQVGHAIELIAT